MCEVIEKGWWVAEVASSYDLVPQTVRNWIGKYRREHAVGEDSRAVLESAEIASLGNELRELRQGCGFLKKGCATKGGGLHACVGDAVLCCVRDEGVWPFGAAMRAEASNRRMLRDW